MSAIAKPLGHLMVDIAGLELTSTEQRFLTHDNIGAVILFSRNYHDKQQLKTLVKQIKQIRTPELLIAVDQEGGRIQRFREEFSALPSPADFEKYYLENEALGLQLAYSGAALMASEILECGIDFSFAPLLDIGNEQSNVLAKRTFANHPESVIAIANAFINGMHAAGMQATGKHFPGHGGVQGDSHLLTPADERDFDIILANDLKPFIALKNKLSAVMTAHVDFPKIDKALPTFSAYWLQDILRKQIGFKGVIFSDDLIMQGAEVGGDIVTRTHKAFAAGCDMALICNDPEAAQKAAHDMDMSYLSDAQASRQRLAVMKPSPKRDDLASLQELSELLSQYRLLTT